MYFPFALLFPLTLLLRQWVCDVAIPIFDLFKYIVDFIKYILVPVMVVLNSETQPSLTFTVTRYNIFFCQPI